MDTTHKEKYNAIIAKIIAKKVTIDTIISYLNKNRLKFNDVNNLKPSDILNSSNDTIKSSKVDKQFSFFHSILFE